MIGKHLQRLTLCRASADNTDALFAQGSGGVVPARSKKQSWTLFAILYEQREQGFAFQALGRELPNR
jgi:hypothetical protein